MSVQPDLPILERLRGAAQYAREFGRPESADIYDRAADEIEELRRCLADCEHVRDGEWGG